MKKINYILISVSLLLASCSANVDGISFSASQPEDIISPIGMPESESSYFEGDGVQKKSLLALDHDLETLDDDNKSRSFIKKAEVTGSISVDSGCLYTDAAYTLTLGVSNTYTLDEGDKIGLIWWKNYKDGATSANLDTLYNYDTKDYEATKISSSSSSVKYFYLGHYDTSNETFSFDYPLYNASEYIYARAYYWDASGNDGAGEYHYSNLVKYSTLNYCYNILNGGGASSDLQQTLHNLLNQSQIDQTKSGTAYTGSRWSEAPYCKVTVGKGEGTYPDGFRTGLYYGAYTYNNKEIASETITLSRKDGSTGWYANSKYLNSNTLTIDDILGDVKHDTTVTLKNNPDDMTIVDGVLTSVSDSISGDVVIPEGVTSIAESAFMGRSLISKVIIPETLTSIGKTAFRNCTNLVSIYIPENVSDIGDYAFANCSENLAIYLGAETLPWTNNKWRYVYYASSNLCYTNIYNNARFSENGLWLFYVSDTNTAVIISCLDNIPNNFKVPEKIDDYLVTSVGEFAFINNISLQNIVFPSSLKSICSYAFQGCTGLESVTGLNECSIGAYSFEGCTKLSTFVLPILCQSIGLRAFYGCSSLQYFLYDGTQEQWNVFDSLLQAATETFRKKITAGATYIHKVLQPSEDEGYTGYIYATWLPRGEDVEVRDYNDNDNVLKTFKWFLGEQQMGSG